MNQLSITSAIANCELRIANCSVKQSNHLVSRLTTIWVDCGNDYEPFMQWVMNFCCWIVQVVLRSQEAKGFILLKKRWVVERTADF